MSLAESLRRARGLPPREVLRRGIGRARRGAGTLRRRALDALLPTYAPHGDVPAGPLLRHLPPLPLDTLRPRAAELAQVCAAYLEHRHDLLGSGWVRVRHGMRAAGVEGFVHPPGPAVRADPAGEWLAGRTNRANLRESRRIWSLVDDPAYVPVDWQLDFRSGYRWSEAAWGRRVRYGHLPGVDVKVPWELSRMQHLPQLACAHALAAGGEPGFAPPGTYRAEFRSQVLDFMAANPPRYGVDWALAMDVAIRAANWLVAYDLFRAHGAVFDAEFERELARGVLDHGRYVAEYLEGGEVRGNHYLADVAGLLFVAAYLPCSRETDGWLAFAAGELASETALQFTADGACFESSTCYHRLSSEMVGYATALALALPAEKRAALREPGGTGSFPPEHFARLARMAEFMAHTARPDGRTVQVGDNDSGRFLRLLPPRQRMTAASARARYEGVAGADDLPPDAPWWDEDALDLRDSAAALNGFFGRPDLAAFAGAGRPEEALVRGLVERAGLPAALPSGDASAAERVRVGVDAAWSMADGPASRAEFAGPGPDLREGARRFAYPDFGLYVYRSDRLFLAVRCGRRGQIATGGHAHRDELAVELTLDGTDLAADPGSYVYTALPERRREYRSARAHFVPRFLAELPDGDGTGGLFELRGGPVGECLYWGPRGFVGRVEVDGTEVVRTVEVRADRVVVADGVRGADGWREAGAPVPPRIPFSPGYGKRLRERPG